mmetsp:Transcript_21466/g.39280  ORF Transcript_21466/g.39280 Transcript_21466/m.39280 type:complete len:81 (+) Transcript_21466:665-907(+)
MAPKLRELVDRVIIWISRWKKFTKKLLLVQAKQERPLSLQHYFPSENFWSACNLNNQIAIPPLLPTTPALHSLQFNCYGI